MNMLLRNEPKNLRICVMQKNQTNLRAYLCVILSPCLETCWFGSAQVVKEPDFPWREGPTPTPLQEGGGGGRGELLQRTKAGLYESIKKKKKKSVDKRWPCPHFYCVYCLVSVLQLPPSWQYHNGCCVRGTMSALSWPPSFFSSWLTGTLFPAPVRISPPGLSKCVA